MTEPLTDLGEILAHLDVEVRPDSYVYATVDAGSPTVAVAQAVVSEPEGVTVVVPADEARRAGLDGGPLFAWLTLTVHSSLEAVGLTAAFSTALAEADISCNVLAGFHHDHVLVPVDDAERAAAVLRALRSGHEGRP